jgi:hypothetical protein
MYTWNCKELDHEATRVVLKGHAETATENPLKNTGSFQHLNLDKLKLSKQTTWSSMNLVKSN